MSFNHRLIAAVGIVAAFSCNRGAVDSNGAGQESGSLSEAARRLVSMIEVTSGDAKVSASIVAIPDSWMERHLKPEKGKTLAPAVGVIPPDRKYDGLVVSLPLAEDVAAMPADRDLFVMIVRGKSAQFHLAGRNRVDAATGDRAPFLRVKLAEAEALKGRHAAPVALALVSMQAEASLGLAATAQPVVADEAPLVIDLPTVAGDICEFPGCDALVTATAPPESSSAPQPALPTPSMQPTQPPEPSNDVVQTPPPSEPPCTTTSTYYRCTLSWTSVWHGFVGVKTVKECPGKEPLITTSVSDFKTADDQRAFRNFIEGKEPAASCADPVNVPSKDAADCVMRAWLQYNMAISSAKECLLTVVPVTGRRCHVHREEYLRMVEECKKQHDVPATSPSEAPMPSANR